MPTSLKSLTFQQGKDDANHKALVEWWDGAKATAETDKAAVTGAGLFGGRMALKLTSIVPAVRALLYLGMLIYFRSIGGYKAIQITGEQASGGVKGPVA